MKKKILVLGNYKDAMYHPFGVISYLDIWDGELTERETEALYSFVQKGGTVSI